MRHRCVPLAECLVAYALWGQNRAEQDKKHKGGRETAAPIPDERLVGSLLTPLPVPLSTSENE